jgi:hypothetical protein
MSAPIQEFLKPFRVLSTNIYAIPSDIFKKLDIWTWKYNRPPTDDRISEIHEWNAQFKRMDGLLNLAYIPGTGLVCFEGNHRRLALRDLDITVLVDILWDVTDEIVMHEFRRINKSVSVPDLYVVETESSLKAEVEQFVAWFRKKYSAHEVASERPQRPNFNRDGLTDQITRLQKETGISMKDLADRLDLLNIRYSEQSRVKLSAKIIEKCAKTGLWLFAWSTVISGKEV